MGRKDTRTPEEREHDALREQARRQDERMNETMSRRDILEAIDNALFQTGGNVGCVAEATDRTLRALREAFE